MFISLCGLCGGESEPHRHGDVENNTPIPSAKVSLLCVMTGSI